MRKSTQLLIQLAVFELELAVVPEARRDCEPATMHHATCALQRATYTIELALLPEACRDCEPATAPALRILYAL